MEKIRSLHNLCAQLAELCGSGVALRRILRSTERISERYFLENKQEDKMKGCGVGKIVYDHEGPN